MAENWELKSLERRVDSLERSMESDRKRAEEEKNKAWTDKWRRQERRMDISTAMFWTIYVAAITTFIVLAATGHLHHH
jgi:hypothetical protein